MSHPAHSMIITLYHLLGAPRDTLIQSPIAESFVKRVVIVIITNLAVGLLQRTTSNTQSRNQHYRYLVVYVNTVSRAPKPPCLLAHALSLKSSFTSVTTAMCIQAYSYFLGCGHGWLDPGFGVEECDDHRRRNLVEQERAVCGQVFYARRYKICGLCPPCCDEDAEKERSQSRDTGHST
jgi:hypothetical protein